MCKPGAGALDRDVRAAMDSVGFWPPQSGKPWGHDLFDLTDDSWGTIVPDVELRYGKMINAIFLIGRGLTDFGINHTGPSCRQWHGTSDYVDSCSGSKDNRYHDSYHHQFTTAYGSLPMHSEVGRFLADDRVVVHCPVFDFGNPNDTPTFRACALIHESWHHWQYEHDFEGAHPIRSDGNDGDYFYRHTAEAFPFGRMYSHSTGPARFHFLSPYQVQAEFLDDLHCFGQSFLSIAVRNRARAEANATLEQRFVNAPRYRVGEPKPF
ncbi:hypothetical protein [Nocardia cyriacigeorgica]|uniref:hypothetical protein n=1 Tax=Nocardia cyriacigeorgica TaxID=135487 RepID=UPI001894879B|nr:hypothetical protein [Nocardia cyriacigeorgica]MBF6413556.1 hypothetical protein [Nocardia cyriacigeorgica]